MLACQTFGEKAVILSGAKNLSLAQVQILRSAQNDRLISKCLLL